MRANDAARILSDPAFKRAVLDTERQLVEKISNGVSDGSPEFEAQEREYCRELRTLKKLVRNLSGTVHRQDLRDSNFAPQTPDKTERK